MANLNDLDDVTISNPKVGDVVKYTALGWENGADAGGEGVNGNPCGNLDHYTRDDESEVITEPWTWNVDSGEGLDVNSPDGSTKIRGDKVSINTSQSAVSLEATTQGSGLVKSLKELRFQDAQVPNGITLAQLIALAGENNNNGGGAVSGTPILSKLFTYNGLIPVYRESLNGWAAYTGGGSVGDINVLDRRIFDWRVSDEMDITLPDWATGCAIIYFQADAWDFSDNITSHPLYATDWIGNFRQYMVHRVTCAGGEFIVGNNDGTSMANIINLNMTSSINSATTAPGTRTAYAETSNFQFLRLTGTSKTFKLQQRIDFLYGGWNKMTLKPGKVIIFPMVIDWNSPNSYETDSLNNPGSFVYSTNEEYQDIIDELVPPYGNTEIELQDTTDLKSGIISALNICNDALAENPGDVTIEGIRANFYALKSETTLAFAEARYKVLVGELSTALNWKFDWEPVGRSLFGGN